MFRRSLPSGLTRGWNPVRRGEPLFADKDMRQHQNLLPGLLHMRWLGNAATRALMNVATLLYIQKDLRQKDALLSHGLYAMPIGSSGVSMVDTRDIAQIAEQELLRRERSEARLPSQVIDPVGPDSLTGAALADIWTETLGRPISYAGDDLDAMERKMKTFAPGWLAYDMRLMLRRYQQDGAAATPAALERLTTHLGRPPRSYRDFAAETAKQWAAAPQATPVATTVRTA
jgi:hypothetical protein